MTFVFFTDRDLGNTFPQVLKDAGFSIERKPNELAAVVRHGVRLLVIVGKATFPDLARSFVATRSRIESFLERTSAPLIAKVYRAGPAELAKDRDAPGRIEQWYPK